MLDTLHFPVICRPHICMCTQLFMSAIITESTSSRSQFPMGHNSWQQTVEICDYTVNAGKMSQTPTKCFQVICRPHICIWTQLFVVEFSKIKSANTSTKYDSTVPGRSKAVTYKLFCAVIGWRGIVKSPRSKTGPCDLTCSISGDSLQRLATPCNGLQRLATACNETVLERRRGGVNGSLQAVARRRKALQGVARDWTCQIARSRDRKSVV